MLTKVNDGTYIDQTGTIYTKEQIKNIYLYVKQKVSSQAALAKALKESSVPVYSEHIYAEWEEVTKELDELDI